MSILVDSGASIQGNDIKRCPHCLKFIEAGKAEKCSYCNSVVCPYCGYCHCPETSLIQRTRSLKLWAERENEEGNQEDDPGNITYRLG